MNKETQYIKSEWFNRFPLGQETPGTRHWLDDAERKLGGDEKLVTYNFNEWRYRGSIEPGQHVAGSFGCSHAMGYGVNTPYAEIINFANCGISGLSNDAITRMAYTYCEQFNPRTICVLWTVTVRREYVRNDGLLVKIRMDDDCFVQQQNDKWDEYNLTKNKLFLKHYCESQKIQLLDYDFFDNDKQARDGMHPGPEWHLNMAAKILEDLNGT